MKIDLKLIGSLLFLFGLPILITYLGFLSLDSTICPVYCVTSNMATWCLFGPIFLLIGPVLFVGNVICLIIELRNDKYDL